FKNGNFYGSDAGNSRVLIYNGIPSANDAAASLVVGQPDMVTGTINTGGISASSLRSPTGVSCDGTHLIVADNSNNRVLVFNSIPSANQPLADLELGQVDFTVAYVNQDAGNTAQNIGGPGGLYYDGSRFFVADTNNSR